MMMSVVTRFGRSHLGVMGRSGRRGRVRNQALVRESASYEHCKRILGSDEEAFSCKQFQGRILLF